MTVCRYADIKLSGECISLLGEVLRNARNLQLLLSSEVWRCNLFQDTFRLCGDYGLQVRAPFYAPSSMLIPNCTLTLPGDALGTDILLAASEWPTCHPIGLPYLHSYGREPIFHG